MLLLQGDTEAAKAFVGNDAEILNNTLYRIKRAIANNPIDAATPLNHIGSEAFLLSLFRRTDLWQDFKKVLADLLCVIAVGLADEPDGIQQQDVTLLFLRFVFLPFFVFLICDLLHGRSPR